MSFIMQSAKANGLQELLLLLSEAGNAVTTVLYVGT